jgi:predicted RNA-binding Zn-ribbon protein involved in translation (DUF1610 family)
VAKKVKLLCPKCKSDSISRDANCFWNIESQEWEISSCDGDIFCDDCGNEFLRAKEQEVEDVQPAQPID